MKWVWGSRRTPIIWVLQGGDQSKSPVNMTISTLASALLCRSRAETRHNYIFEEDT